MITEMPLSMSSVFLAFSQADLVEGGELALVGVGVVFSALILIWVMLVIIQKSAPHDDTQQAPPATAAAAESQPSAAPETDRGDEEIDSETLALIMASVMAVTRSPVRIRHIQRVTYPPTQAWAEHGRALIHTSHRIRKN